jgi:membrane-associated phospholipid phosphatase
VAPPRLAELGLLDTVTQHSHAYRVLQPPAFTNIYAAMPSLHVGWDLLMGIAIATVARHRVMRLVGVLLPALMAVAVVVTANHYVVDVVAGASVALAGLVVARRRETVSRLSKDETSPARRVPTPIGVQGAIEDERRERDAA